MNIGIIVYSDNNIVLEKYIDARMNTYHTSALFISIIIPRMICVPHWKRKYRYLLPCTVFAIFRTFSNRFSPTKSRHTLYWEPQGFPLQGVSDFIFFSKNTKYFCPIQDSPCIANTRFTLYWLQAGASSLIKGKNNFRYCSNSRCSLIWQVDFTKYEVIQGHPFIGFWLYYVTCLYKVISQELFYLKVIQLGA